MLAINLMFTFTPEPVIMHTRYVKNLEGERVKQMPSGLLTVFRTSLGLYDMPSFIFDG